MSDHGLNPALADWVRTLAATQDPRVLPTTPVAPLLTRGLVTRPIAPAHSQVYLCAGVIVKIHGRGTDPDRLQRRLRALSAPDLDRVWIQPLRWHPIPAPGERLATLWPRVTVLNSIDRPPWVEIGQLLARLHRMPIVGDPPRLGGHSRLARAVAVLREHGSPWSSLADLGDELVGTLAEPARTTLAHGDFHLGQLGHTPLRRSWKLLDVDDFGLGDPAWDLARPAGFWAAGLLDDSSWQALLHAYRDAGGPAVPAEGDPWPALHAPAQAALMITAAQALRSPDGQALAAMLSDVSLRLRTWRPDPPGA